ncbi:MAG: GNAT family N-acetyltransferase [Actinobacteria bacterium]|nr:GNAT family N-acetyltransferase [Actinomycetota bacterium]
MGQISIRHAEERDAEAIRSIYNYEVEHETATFDLVPRSLDDQLEWQRARTGAFCVYVAELDGQVVGFGALSPYKERAAYRTSVEDSVYVRRDLGRQGIGRAMLSHLLEAAENGGFHAVMARITTLSEGSIALHEALGFQLVGIERQIGRKFNKWLDVALMQCLLTER